MDDKNSRFEPIFNEKIKIFDKNFCNVRKVPYLCTNKTIKQQQTNLKTLKVMMVYFFFEPDETAKFKKAFEDHKLAKRLVSECFLGKYDLVVYEFCHLDDKKLLKISEYLGIAPNMPNFIIL